MIQAAEFTQTQQQIVRQGSEAAGRAQETAFAQTLENTAAASYDLDTIFEEAAARYGLPVKLLRAVAKTESSFNANAVSGAGAMGVMQLMPDTARAMGVSNPFDARQNILGGARYLKQNLERFDGDLSLALAAYNAGAGAVERYGGIPPYAETQRYVDQILRDYNGQGLLLAKRTALPNEQSQTLYRSYVQGTLTGQSRAQAALARILSGGTQMGSLLSGMTGSSSSFSLSGMAGNASSAKLLLQSGASGLSTLFSQSGGLSLSTLFSQEQEGGADALTRLALLAQEGTSGLSGAEWANLLAVARMETLSGAETGGLSEA